MAIRVTVWNEYLHEVQFPEVAEVYPKASMGASRSFSTRRALRPGPLPCGSRSTA